MVISQAEFQQTSTDITQLMQRYFDGLYLSDRKLLESVFHTRAHYVCATETELVYLTLAEYLPMVAARPSPASRNELRRDSIAALEFAGGNTALVRAHCAIGNKYFTDLLTLVRVDGRWQVISKVFHYELFTAN